MQPRNQLLRDGFSVNIKKSGGNAGLIRLRNVTLDHSTKTLSYRECQK